MSIFNLTLGRLQVVCVNGLSLVTCCAASVMGQRGRGGVLVCVCVCLVILYTDDWGRLYISYSAVVFSIVIKVVRN